MANSKKLQASGGRDLFLSQEEEAHVKETMRNSQQEGAERRRIRQGYREIMEDLAENKHKLIDPSDESNLLTESLIKVDLLFKQVKQTREATLDSTSLVQLADYGKKKAHALQTDFLRFQPFDYCERVKVAIAGELDNRVFSDADWINLGRAVESHFSKTPVLRFMCGSFERGEVSLKRNRVAKEKDRDDTTGKATKLKQLSTLAEVGRGELTTAHVENLLSTLWNVYETGDNQPLDFFEFVTHPTSFGRTVENIFYTSFLVRDGHAKVSLDAEDLPVIEPVQKVEEMEKDWEPPQKHQLVLRLTQSMWKDIVTTFKIEEPLIKNIRPNPPDST